MKKIFAFLFVAFFYSCDGDDDITIALPTLSTLEISQLTDTSALSGGEITSDGGGTIISRGLCYSTSSNPTIEDNVVSNASGTGRFITSMTGLTEGVAYYARAYATNGAGTAYGNEIVFTTIEFTAPVLVTSEVSLITQTTAISGGEITSDGGLPITGRGICYDTSPSPTVLNGISTGNDQVNFIANLSELTAGTTYYVRAFASNSAGTSYGNEITFSTLPVTKPVLSTTDITSITAYSATSGGEISSDGGGLILERGICWSTTGEPTINDSRITAGSGSAPFEIELTGLAKTTTYYVRAYATNSAGTAYGVEKSFTTLSIAVGDVYQGGIIFYIDPTGDHGLIVADSDLGSSMPWGCPYVDVSTSAAVGAGKQNTINILATCSEAGIAAKACSDLVANGYDDWFLPSIDDLQLISDNLIENGIGNFVENQSYWSSTQQGDFTSYAFDVRHHSFFNSRKNTILMVRPVRAF